MSGRTGPVLTDNRAEALRITPVSRETSAVLSRYIDLLLQWQATTNLIAPSTIPHLWTRHVADSLQLLELAPNTRVWVDLGAGAGFPGIPIACALSGQSKAQVHLVESNGKKAAFLREATRVLALPTTVHRNRIEDFVDSFPDTFEVITARALAPLQRLFQYVAPLLARGGIGLFPKGQDVEVELTEASKYWIIDAELAPSRTESAGRIVILRGLQARAGIHESR